jgi:hypothetical protein
MHTNFAVNISFIASKVSCVVSETGQKLSDENGTEP